MDLVRFLQGIGDRLGILEAVPDKNAETATRIQTRTVTLQELSCEIKSAEMRTLADSQSEFEVPFDKIFETAGIPSAQADWTIERLRQTAAGEPFKNRTREEVRKSMLDLLHSEKVPVEQIVRDAIARDKALDAFEACMNEKMKRRSESGRRRMLEIESQIRDLQGEKSSLEEKLKADEAGWSEWKKRKRALERELASTASYIVDHPVVTTDEE
jgi:hypothetical protein